jgi:hypothetical protein
VRRKDASWAVAVVNLLGSVFFMLAALAAFVRPGCSHSRRVRPGGLAPGML